MTRDFWRADHKQSAKFVFTQYEPATGTGVNNKFYVFLIGLLMSQFTLLAYDVSLLQLTLWYRGSLAPGQPVTFSSW